MIKKGYTLLSLIIAISILSSILTLSLISFKTLNFDHIIFYSDYLYNQSNSILNRENVNFDEIEFNSNGNVKHATTIIFNKKDVIIHLGNGYASFKKK